ncbi:phosphotransferase [Mangrovicoccus algicola]|uniref:Phosphotransferase n=1 Tax=Mangrovicoccus algicola TaxID=2771008 RepID=A0A8J6YWW1_9RHOB|nr:phosphotransferase [Mangrovicoccus algicola]MBE3639097.1 phosphotransferase [Mangrovicoccus algicola]
MAPSSLSSLSESIGALPTGLREAILSWIETQPGGAGGWELRIGRDAGRRGGRRRVILEASGPDGRHLAIKAHASRRRNSGEYRALAAMAAAGAETAAPVHLDARGRFLAMEWIDGPRLSELLGGPGREEMLLRAGLWLAALHRPGRRLPLLRRAPPRAALPLLKGEGAIGEALARLRRRQRQQGGARGPVRLLHGDFHAGNLFMRDGRPVGFDREHDVYGPVQHDLAKFLVDLGQRRAEAAAEGSPWAGTGEEDRRRFFEGYGALMPENVAGLDLAEDRLLFRLWRRGVLRRGGSALEELMRARGLLGNDAGSRPGRLVQGAGGADWVSDAEPGPRRGLVSLHPGKLTGG